MVQWCSQPPRPDAHSSTSAGRPGAAGAYSLGVGDAGPSHPASAHWTEATARAAWAGPLHGHPPVSSVRVTLDTSPGEAGWEQPGARAQPVSETLLVGGTGRSRGCAGSRCSSKALGRSTARGHPSGPAAAAHSPPLTVTAAAVGAEPVASIAATLVPAGAVGAGLPAAWGRCTVVHVCWAHTRATGTCLHACPPTHVPRTCSHTSTQHPGPADTHTGHAPRPQGRPACCGGRMGGCRVVGTPSCSRDPPEENLCTSQGSRCYSQQSGH